MRRSGSTTRAIATATAILVATSGTTLSAQSLHIGKSVRTVDLRGGTEGHGKVQSAAFDDAGNAAVVEQGTGRVALLSADGGIIARSDLVPQAGSALSQPVKIISRDHALLVLDAGSRSLVRFTRKDNAMVAAGSTQIAVQGISSMCSMDGRLYVMGSSLWGTGPRGALVHEINVAGEIVRSFGELVPNASPAKTMALSQGDLLCLNDAHLLIASSRLSGAVSAFDEEGKRVWTSQLPNFQPLGLLDYPKRIQYSFAADSLWDEVASAVLPQKGVIALQSGRRHGRADGTYLRVHTVLLSRVDGRVLGEQDDLPLVAALQRGHLAILASNERTQVWFAPFTVTRP